MGSGGGVFGYVFSRTTDGRWTRERRRGGRRKETKDVFVVIFFDVVRAATTVFS